MVAGAATDAGRAQSTDAPCPSTHATPDARPLPHPPQVPAPPSAGLLGPTLAVEVGQKLRVVFKNALAFPANLMLDGGLAVRDSAQQTGNRGRLFLHAPACSCPVLTSSPLPLSPPDAAAVR